jgi:RHS repeat-associated protein
VDADCNAMTFICSSNKKLTSERNPDYLEVSYQYDGAGRLLNRILSNGAKTSYTWDAGNRLASLTNFSADGTVLNSTAYERDRVGNITQKTESGDASQAAPVIADVNRYYSYGSSTNRLYTVRRLSESGTIINNLSYDDDGNLTLKQDGSSNTLQSFTYDLKGRVKTIATNGVSPTSQFLYDPSNYRIGKTDSEGSKTYLLEGEHLDGIMSGDQWKAKYMRGAVIDEVVNGYEYDESGNWTNYTYHHDSLQSVLGLSGHEGSLLQTMQYEPFGDTIATTGTSNDNRLHYTGREEDPDSGLYYYRARYYDPELGRFITEDPKGFAAGINFYAYAGNNPVNYNDPLGLKKGDCWDPRTLNDPDLWDVVFPDWESGAALQRGWSALKAEVSILSGAGQLSFAAGALITGQGGTAFAVGTHGASNFSGGVGDLANVIDSGNRTGNFLQKGYGDAAEGLGFDRSYGTKAFTAVDTVLGFGMGAKPVTVQEEITIMGGVTLEKYSKNYEEFVQPGFVIANDVLSTAVGIDSIFSPSDASAASGGFVIYPNKANLNMTTRVYEKE